MRLNWWESLAGMLGAAFAGIFVLSNVRGIGIALAAADLLWLLRRVRITERYDKPARYTTLRGKLAGIRLGLLTLIYATCIDGFFVILRLTRFG